MKCDECGIDQQKCLCSIPADFTDGHEGIFEDLLEMEMAETVGAKRCLACYFFNCRCKKGLKGRRK